MTYALSGPLQAAVYDALRASGPLAAHVGDSVYDALPLGTAPATYVRLGAENVVDASDVSGTGAVHTFTVTVLSTDRGFAATKEIAGVVCDILQDAALTLSRGSLVSLRFQRAQAARTENGTVRQIDLRFRARVSDDAS